MLKRAVLTLLALLVASGVIVAAISFSPACINQADQQDAAADKRHDDQNADSQRVFAAMECGTKTLGQWVIDHLDELSTVTTALATVAIGFFTYTLYCATTQQARITSDALKLARDEFISAWRPKLRVRNIVVCHPSITDGPAPEQFTEGLPLQCQFFVTNIGGTPAAITEVFAQIYQSPSGLPMRQPYEGLSSNIHIPSGTIAPGQSTVFDFTSAEVIVSAVSIGTKNIHHQRLFVMGWLEYRDDIGVVRRTAFCREFKRGPWDDGRFRRVKSRDYEHEE